MTFIYFSTAGKTFSFYCEEINEILKIPLPEPDFFKSTDGVKIAYYSYIPVENPGSAVVFIHGDGAYSGSGYQRLAENLCRKHNIAVYLMDVRGHGNSAGAKGDSPSIIQVWEDLKIFIQIIKNKNHEVPLYLAGHSSGGGLILNYLTWYTDNSIAGYIFISPEFGYKSDTARKNRTEFAYSKTAVFIKNALTGGRYGNEKAVIFNYPDGFLKDCKLMTGYYTYNMALAVTPDKPYKQFKNIDKPFGLFVGEDDELLVPENLIMYAKLPPETIQEKSLFEIIKGKKHLSILTDADKLIFNSIKKISK